ncbi:uncharacterized protein [Hoplias malabaricus]|uniref:uncharacterized protein n=1 Tax=Hoplias malabaricus TaxID=27720 RepID=UPI003463498B
MFEFRYNGKLFCVDASLEDGSLGRLVNDDHLNPNSKMKTITIAGKPHLGLFATRNINPGEEITYNYGDSEWPWRCKPAVINTSLQTVNEGDQLQPKKQIPEATCEIVPEEGPVSIPMPTLPPVREMEQNVAQADTLVSPTSLLTTEDQLQPENWHPQVPRERTREETERDCADQMQPERKSPVATREQTERNCEHEIALATVSSMNKCVECVGPVASLKWIGLQCKVCSSFWHKSCFKKLEKSGTVPVSWGKGDSSSDEDNSQSTDEEYVPELPEATTQLAKVSKILLAMEKGCLSDLQGKSLDEIEIEDEINATEDSNESEPDNEAVDDAMSAPRPTRMQKTRNSSNSAIRRAQVCTDHSPEEVENTKKRTRTLWSKQEVMAVMKHFKPHITKGKLATMAECQQCKDAEDPVLKDRNL